MADMRIAYDNMCAERGRKFIGQVSAKDVRPGDGTWDFGGMQSFTADPVANEDGTVTLAIKGRQPKAFRPDHKIGIYRKP